MGLEAKLAEEAKQRILNNVEQARRETLIMNLFEKALSDEYEEVRIASSGQLIHAGYPLAKSTIRLCEKVLNKEPTDSSSEQEREIRKNMIATLVGLKNTEPEMVKSVFLRGTKEWKRSINWTIDDLYSYMIEEFDDRGVRILEKLIEIDNKKVQQSIVKSMIHLAEYELRTAVQILSKVSFSKYREVSSDKSRVVAYITEYAFDYPYEDRWKESDAVSYCKANFRKTSEAESESLQSKDKSNAKEKELEDRFKESRRRDSSFKELKEQYQERSSCNALRNLAEEDPVKYVQVFNRIMEKKAGPDNLKAAVDMKKEAVASLSRLVSSLEDGPIKPIEDEGYQFLKAYLDSTDLSEEEEFSETQVTEKLTELVREQNVNYAEMKRVLERGEAKDLDEIIDCARIEIPGYSIIRRVGKGEYKAAYLCENKEHPDTTPDLIFIDVENIGKTKGDFSEIKVDEKLIERIKDPDIDHRRLKTILEHGETQDLDEIVECAKVDIPGYTALKKLGKGGFKNTYLCKHKELKDATYALLITDVNNLSEKADSSLKRLGKTALENCRDEASKIAMFESLRNKEHLPLIREPPKYIEEKGIYYWTEDVVDKINLEQFKGLRKYVRRTEDKEPEHRPNEREYEYIERVRNEKEGFSQTKEIVEFIQGLVNTLDEVHDLGYFHGDLNFSNVGAIYTHVTVPRNIPSFGREDDRGDVIIRPFKRTVSKITTKILDWGLCSSIPDVDEESDGREFLGHRLTKSPEVYEGNLTTNKSDLWSLGVMTYRLLAGEYPFKWSFEGTEEDWRTLPPEEKRRFEQEVFEKIKEHRENPDKIYENLREKGLGDHPLARITSLCLTYDPEQRGPMYLIREELDSFHETLLAEERRFDYRWI
jgi:serine/threonine protein kinase